MPTSVTGGLRGSTATSDLVSKLPCMERDAVYIGETLRKLDERLKDHKGTWRRRVGRGPRSQIKSGREMGAIHKMAATLGDSPTARALRGTFSCQPGLPHLGKHFFLGFLFPLRAKEPNTNKKFSGSTPPSRHNADFCFHRAKISDKRPRELLRLAPVGNLCRLSGV